MKGLAVVLVILFVVAGVAVTGSRAQPLPRMNPGLGSCQPNGPIALESVRCKPVVVLAAPAELDREFAGDIGGDWAAEAGGDFSDPEFVVKALVDLAVKAGELAVKAGFAAAVGNLVHRALDWAFGETAPGDTRALLHLDASIFDPAQ